MAYKYSDEFQSYPCRYDWYLRFSNAENTGDQEGTIVVYDRVEGKLKPIAMLTNLYCKEETEVEHLGETYSIPVYTLNSLSTDDEIDPLMVSSKIPSAEFEFSFSGVSKTYSLQELNEVIDMFEGKTVRVYRGFFAYSGNLRNEDGVANLAYSKFEHDVECLGTYIIKESTYDYVAYTVKCSCDSMVFDTLTDAKFYASDSYWNQRYPYPYDDDYYIIGFPADKVLDGEIFEIPASKDGIKLYGSSDDVVGLSTKHIRDLTWVQDAKRSDDPVETWSEHIFEYNYGPYEGEYQFTETGEPIEFKTVGVWQRNGDLVESDWVCYWYEDVDKSGTFSSGDKMLTALHGGATEIITENSTIYAVGDDTVLWDDEIHVFTVRWKMLDGREPGAVRSFSIYNKDSGELIKEEVGSRYILDSDGNYYTEVSFEAKDIGFYEVKCWYGTYQYDATITLAITPVFNLGDIPSFGGIGETQETAYLGYHMVTINGTPTKEEVSSFEKLVESGLEYVSQYYKILGWVAGEPGIPPIEIPIEPGIPAFSFDWSFRSFETELQKVGGDYYTYSLDEPTDLTSLCNNWTETSMVNALVCYSLMNDLHMVPSEGGNWMMVSGKYPTFYPFRDVDGTLEATNGIHYPFVKDASYKINTAMVLSSGFSKDQLELSKVTHTKETLVNAGKLGGAESETFTLPTKERFVSQVDLSGGSPKPSDAAYGYEYASTLPLSDGIWYDTKSIKIMSGDTEVGALFGTDQAASALMGGKNYAIRGNGIALYDVLWNSGLDLMKDVEQPFSFSVPKYSPTAYYVDKNGDTTSSNEELVTVEVENAYYGYTGLSERMVERASGEWLSPLYAVSWSMVDDPSLRVGTLVYLPIHNRYVGVYIKRQKRSFSGAGQLDCEGWVVFETDELALDATPTGCVGTHWVGDPITEDKGDFTTFTWVESDDWGGFYGQLVRGILTYESKDGSTVVTLADQFFTSGEPMSYSINWQNLEYQLGIEVDKLGESGDFYIELRYYTYEVSGKAKFDYDNIIPSHQKFSELYAGYAVASGEVAPLAFNHYLIG